MKKKWGRKGMERICLTFAEEDSLMFEEVLLDLDLFPSVKTVLTGIELLDVVTTYIDTISANLDLPSPIEEQMEEYLQEYWTICRRLLFNIMGDIMGLEVLDSVRGFPSFVSKDPEKEDITPAGYVQVESSFLTSNGRNLVRLGSSMLTYIDKDKATAAQPDDFLKNDFWPTMISYANQVRNTGEAMTEKVR